MYKVMMKTEIWKQGNVRI